MKEYFVLGEFDQTKSTLFTWKETKIHGTKLFLFNALYFKNCSFYEEVYFMTFENVILSS